MNLSSLPLSKAVVVFLILVAAVILGITLIVKLSSNKLFCLLMINYEIDKFNFLLIKI